MLRVLDHVGYNCSVHWQGEEQSVPCKSSDSNPGFCVCHLVKREIKCHLIILLVLGSICSILRLSHWRAWVGTSGHLYASQHLLGQCVSVPNSRHWWIASICYIIQWLLILALSASSIQTLKVSSQTSVIKFRCFLLEFISLVLDYIFKLLPVIFRPINFILCLKWKLQVQFYSRDTFGDREGNHRGCFILAFPYLKKCLFSDQRLPLIATKLFSSGRVWVTIFLPNQSVSNTDLEGRLLLVVMLSHWFF